MSQIVHSESETQTAADLVKRAQTLADAKGIELTTMSKRLLNDHRRLGAVASGASFLRPPTLRAAFAKLEALERAHAEAAPPSPAGASRS